MSILSIIVLIIIGGIIYAFRDQLLMAAMYIGFFMGVGALIGWWLFDNASAGSTVGFWAAVFFGVRYIVSVSDVTPCKINDDCLHCCPSVRQQFTVLV